MTVRVEPALRFEPEAAGGAGADPKGGAAAVEAAKNSREPPERP